MINTTVQCFNSLAHCPVLKSDHIEVSTTAGKLSTLVHTLMLTKVNSSYFRAKTAVDSYGITNLRKLPF